MSNDLSFHRKLQEEIIRLEKEKLLSPEQRDAILQRYHNEMVNNKTGIYETGSNATSNPLTAIPNGKESPLFIRTVMALAVFFFGLGAFLLISFNWAYLSGFTKLTIVGTALAAAHVAGLCLRTIGKKPSKKYWADAAFFFAGIMFGIGIWQVGQVFHIPADWSEGLWLWSLGVLLMALVIGSTPLHLLVISLLTVWFCGTLDTVSWGVGKITSFYDYIPIFAWSLPIFTVLGIIAARLKNNQIVLLLYSLLLLFWWFMQGAIHIDTYASFHVITTGLMCLAFPAWFMQGTCRTFLRCVGYMLIFGGMIPLGFMDFWREALFGGTWRYFSGGDFYGRVYWVFILFIIDLLILECLISCGNGKGHVRNFFQQNKSVFMWSLTILGLWIGTYVFPLIIVIAGNTLLFMQRYDFFEWNPLFLGGMLVGNIMFVWLAVVLLLKGMKQNRAVRFWFGVSALMLWAVIRYFDLFSEVGGMLGAAAIFFCCGLFLLGIVFVWTRRKKTHADPVFVHPQEFIPPRWFLPLRNLWVRIGESERSTFVGIILAALIQFSLLAVIIVDEVQPHLTDTSIKVATVPVDPRDLFRGDYVVLRYEFSNIRSIVTDHDFTYATPEYEYFPAGKTVYVSMIQDGDLWKPAGIDLKKPKDGIFLRGVYQNGGDIEFGIESYFVQEGTGKALETAIRQNAEDKQVIVELAIGTNGRAAIKTVTIE